MRIVATGLRFPEGPVWRPDGSVLLVEIERETLSRVTPDGRVEVVAEIPGGPNGAAIGPDGRAFVCNNGGFDWLREGTTLRPTFQPENYRGGSIEAVDLGTGRVDRIYEACGGRRLRGPNDLVFDGAGGFWFTDLGKRRPREVDYGGIYWARADGSEIREVVHGMLMPNGIGLSPDGSVLYAAETATGRLWAWDVTGPGELRRRGWPAPHGGARLAANTGGATRLDSLAVTAGGKVCVAALDRCAVAVVDPATGGTSFVDVPDLGVTNICFGGDDRRTAFVTMSHEGKLAALDWVEPGLVLAHGG